MPRALLTDISVRALKSPEKGQLAYWDTSLPGFGVRVSQGGTKTFILVAGANRERTTLGRVGVVTLSEARTEAKHLLAKRTLGHIKPKSVRFELALDRFVELHCKPNNRPSTANETARLLRTHFLPALKGTDIEGITRTAITKRLDRLAPSEANHAFTAIRTMLTWCVRRGYLGNSPCEAMQLPNKTASRDRVLTETEIKAIWHAAQSVGYPYGTIVQLLLLTGQRRGEIAALQWNWIDRAGRTITLPSAVTKNGRKHTFPYANMVEAILSTIPMQGDLLFPASRTAVRGKPTTIFNGWAKPKALLDATIAEAGEAIPHWTLHDLRRTFATNLAALQTPVHVTEKLLNHVSGTVSGVAAIYNRHSYMDEMRVAIVKWEERLTAPPCHSLE